MSDGINKLEKKAIKEMAAHRGVYYWMPRTCQILFLKGLADPVGNTNGFQLTEKGREMARELA